MNRSRHYDRIENESYIVRTACFSRSILCRLYCMTSFPLLPFLLHGTRSARKPKTFEELLEAANKAVKASGAYAGLFGKNSEKQQQAMLDSEESEGDNNAAPAPKKLCGPTTKAARQAAKVAMESVKSADKPKQIKKAPLPKKRKYSSKSKNDGNSSEPSNPDDAKGDAGASVMF